jgi:hypothetical protein
MRQSGRHVKLWLAETRGTRRCLSFLLPPMSNHEPRLSERYFTPNRLSRIVSVGGPNPKQEGRDGEAVSCGPGLCGSPGSSGCRERGSESQPGSARTRGNGVFCRSDDEPQRGPERAHLGYWRQQLLRRRCRTLRSVGQGSAGSPNSEPRRPTLNLRRVIRAG